MQFYQQQCREINLSMRRSFVFCSCFFPFLSWDMSGESLMQKYWLPWLVGMPAETSFAICSMMFSGLFQKLPNLRVCFAHGGGSFPGTIGRIEHGFYCRPDLVAVDCKVPPRDWMGHFWVDSLLHDTLALQAVTDLVGPNRVALGTDYPFPLGEIQIGALINGMSEPTEFTHQHGWIPSTLTPEQRAQWTEERKRQMLWKNALEFLGVDHQEERFIIDWKARLEAKKQAQLKESEEEKQEEMLEKSMTRLSVNGNASSVNSSPQ